MRVRHLPVPRIMIRVVSAGVMPPRPGYPDLQNSEQRVLSRIRCLDPGPEGISSPRPPTLPICLSSSPSHHFSWIKLVPGSVFFSFFEKMIKTFEKGFASKYAERNVAFCHKCALIAHCLKHLVVVRDFNRSRDHFKAPPVTCICLIFGGFPPFLTPSMPAKDLGKNVWDAPLSTALRIQHRFHTSCMPPRRISTCPEYRMSTAHT